MNATVALFPKMTATVGTAKRRNKMWSSLQRKARETAGGRR